MEELVGRLQKAIEVTPMLPMAETRVAAVAWFLRQRDDGDPRTRAASVHGCDFDVHRGKSPSATSSIPKTRRNFWSTSLRGKGKSR